MLQKLVKIRQNMQAPRIADVYASVREQIESLALEGAVLEGGRIGITVGSRGIRDIVDIARAIVDSVREWGAVPVVVAAMGSHGGGTASGQREVLESLGVMEASVGAEILCHAEATQIGETLGIPVYCNTEAARLDGLIVANRIKTHTDFSGEIESGLCKMMTIGLGNHKGASTAHYYAVNNGYSKMIRESAEVFLQRLPIICGVGIVENWKNETMRVESMLPCHLIEREMELLEFHKHNSLKLPFSSADVLVVGEMGKNISGAGMDTKVIGRIRILGQREPDFPKITNIVVLNLTEESHGNATGIGLADYTTMKVYESIDLKSTMINGLASMSPDQVRIPVILDNDRDAIEAACKTLGPAREKEMSIAVIKNTAELEEMAVSENLLETLEREVEILEEAQAVAFDDSGALIVPHFK